MSQQTIFEIIGYVGSALVLTSFLMSSVVKLRIINSLGCFVSVIYGLMIHAYPTLVMNGALLVINLYFLWKMSKSKTAEYHVTKANAEDGFIEYFLNTYKEDIHKYFPAFTSAAGDNYIRVSMCGDKVAGILIGDRSEEGVLNVDLDYTTPEFRDLSVGKWFYAHIDKQEISAVEVAVPTCNHEKYMEKMGFVKTGDKYLMKF